MISYDMRCYGVIFLQMAEVPMRIGIVLLMLRTVMATGRFARSSSIRYIFCHENPARCNVVQDVVEGSLLPSESVKTK